jgi:SepF-like predicted cell division protein (DUF552 family)
MFFGQPEPPIESLPVVGADAEGAASPVRQSIAVATLSEFPQTHAIIRTYAEGRIVMVRLAEPLTGDSVALANALRGLNQSCQGRGGRMVGLDDDWFVMLPKDVELEA